VIATELQRIPVIRQTFNQSAIYRAEAECLAAYRALHGAELEPSAEKLRDMALALLADESKAVTP